MRQNKLFGRSIRIFFFIENLIVHLISVWEMQGQIENTAMEFKKTNVEVTDKKIPSDTVGIISDCKPTLAVIYVSPAALLSRFAVCIINYICGINVWVSIGDFFCKADSQG